MAQSATETPAGSARAQPARKLLAGRRLKSRERPVANVVPLEEASWVARLQAVVIEVAAGGRRPTELEDVRADLEDVVVGDVDPQARIGLLDALPQVRPIGRPVDPTHVVV